MRQTPIIHRHCLASAQASACANASAAESRSEFDRGLITCRLLAEVSRLRPRNVVSEQDSERNTSLQRISHWHLCVLGLKHCLDTHHTGPTKVPSWTGSIMDNAIVGYPGRSTRNAFVKSMSLQSPVIVLWTCSQRSFHDGHNLWNP